MEGIKRAPRTRPRGPHRRATAVAHPWGRPCAFSGASWNPLGARLRPFVPSARGPRQLAPRGAQESPRRAPEICKGHWAIAHLCGAGPSLSGALLWLKLAFSLSGVMPTEEHWYAHNDWVRTWWQPGPPPLLMLKSPASLCDVYSMMSADITYKLLWFLDIQDIASGICVNMRCLGLLAVYARLKARLQVGRAVDSLLSRGCSAHAQA